MPAAPLITLTVGLFRTWAGFLRDWDRSLRAANHPERTRYNFLLAAAQLGRFLAEHSPDSDADDPTLLDARKGGGIFTCATRRSSGCTATPARGCPRSATCTSTTLSGPRAVGPAIYR
jgi:hypothetical protein